MHLNRTPLYLRPLAQIIAADATPGEAAYLRRMLPSLERAVNSGEPVAAMLRHVREQVAILDAAKGERATGNGTSTEAA
ncbi:hypothetical protein FBZ83_12362 [Azospirillum brasilense]|uniref:Uncharacterized protein n=1 Tax=Azospirillum brasilense TaxID=192 RepID=A0A560BSP0_AZOBR|nr:hypothetical protein [Azospirillum brasilense]TWA75635.1 hypothetical protein FBZ83_12362 [Azospirillum brasilense]